MTPDPHIPEPYAQGCPEAWQNRLRPTMTNREFSRRYVEAQRRARVAEELREKRTALGVAALLLLTALVVVYLQWEQLLAALKGLAL
jgi:hypothetical protein